MNPNPEPDVWISTGRKGIDFHVLESPEQTRCGRSTRTGSVLSLADAEAWYGSKPCPRCHR